MKKILYCVVVIITSALIAVICTNSCRADQVSELRKVVVLRITNEDLLPILDSIIRHEKNCEYYSPDLYFSIHKRVVNDTIAEFQIGGIGSLLVDLGRDYYKGCFEHEGHIFFIVGQELDPTLFTNTNEKKEFSFFKSGWVTDKGEIILLDIEDDRFSYWIYDYVDGVFCFEEMYDTYCNCTDSF